MTQVMRGEVIEKAYAGSWKAHKSPDKPYLIEKINRNDPQEVIFCFPGSGAVRDWYSQKNFGETKIDLGLFPSLRSIGIDEQAFVNEAFQKKFQEILSAKPSLADEVLYDNNNSLTLYDLVMQTITFWLFSFLFASATIINHLYLFVNSN